MARGRHTSEPAAPGASASAAGFYCRPVSWRQPAAPAILHPQDSAKSHKKRTWTQHELAGRAGLVSQRGRLYRWPDLAGAASGYGHLTPAGQRLKRRRPA